MCLHWQAAEASEKAQAARDARERAALAQREKDTQEAARAVAQQEMERKVWWDVISTSLIRSAHTSCALERNSPSRC